MSKCQACERGDHTDCGMQSWCDCDCEGYDPEAKWFDKHDDVLFEEDGD